LIHHLKYNQIDFKKYDTCITNAYNSKLYAISWYLDIVSNKNWEVLILDDYKAVMPLPFKRVKRHFFKRMVTQPSFCQQLGVFSKTELEAIQFKLFITKLKSFKLFSYNFNAGNTSKLTNSVFSFPNNYELDLHIDFNDLIKKYNSGLKANLKKAKKNELFITKGLEFQLFEKLKISTSFHKITASQFKMMKMLVTAIQANNKGDFYAVYKADELLSVIFFIEDKNRIIDLLSATSKKGRKLGATSFLLNYIFEKNKETNTVFDFEGSMIPSVAEFFKSFGAQNIPYHVILNS